MIAVGRCGSESTKERFSAAALCIDALCGCVFAEVASAFQYSRAAALDFVSPKPLGSTPTSRHERLYILVIVPFYYLHESFLWIYFS